LSILQEKNSLLCKTKTAAGSQNEITRIGNVFISKAFASHSHRISLCCGGLFIIIHMKSFIPKELQQKINDVLKKLDRRKNAEQTFDALLELIQPVDFLSIVYPNSQKNLDDLNELDAKFSQPDANGKLNPDALTKEESKRFKNLQSIVKSYKLNQRHYKIISVEKLLQIAKENNLGLCRNQGSFLAYNGEYWLTVDKDIVKQFLVKVSQKMGTPTFDAKDSDYTEKMYNQLFQDSYLMKPDRDGKVLVNLQNGTIFIEGNNIELKEFDSTNLLTYQLSYNYSPTAYCPLFFEFLNKVLPDINKQNILAEFLGYVFVPVAKLKLEKTILLYGQGGNGKSVIFDVVRAILGEENICSYTLQNLTDVTGYYRAKLPNKLLNYSSEIGKNNNNDFVKKLISIEPIDCRNPYNEPFQGVDYAKSMFNCNELPKEVEHTNAFFRRLVILNFDVTIPKNEQDKQLAQKIIGSELSGIFNWILEGLKRLIKQGDLTKSQAVEDASRLYQTEMNSVLIFIEEEGYHKDPYTRTYLKQLYDEYKLYCNESGRRAVAKGEFKKRMETNGFFCFKNEHGNFFNIDKSTPDGI